MYKKYLKYNRNKYFESNNRTKIRRKKNEISICAINVSSNVI